MKNPALRSKRTPATSSPEPLIHGANIERWALIVGISRYADPQLSLHHAANDASKLRATLLEPTAGAFPADHVLSLIDEGATLATLNKALRTFLKRPAADDLVVLFFACHGSRDPERLGNLYLLPHDTDPRDISGTALPMREVEVALRETLHSRRVVVLVDACHSGGLGDAFAGRRAVGDDAAALNAYLGALSSSRGGVSLMTSAMANESSIEGEQWGDGHGVFTHFVLEGLRGKADRPPYDGIVTVGELFDYVQHRVKDATDDSQHPHISASADRGLVLAVTGSLSADRHLELARRLASVAELLAEPACWRGAAVQYGETMRLRGAAAQADAGVPRALALFRSGNASAAEQALRQLPPALEGVRAALGLVELALGRVDDARATLLQPEPVSPSAGLLFAPNMLRGHRVALLAGLDAVDPTAFAGWDGRLASPVAELRELGKVLETRFDFDEVQYLLDGEATMDAIRAGLRELMQRSASCEAVVFAFSGHGSQIPGDGAAQGRRDSTLVAFDGQLASAEIDGLLRQSAAGRTTLIVSAAHSGRFAERAVAGGYEAIASCAENQVDFDGVRLGAFMEALLPHLSAGIGSATLAQATRRGLRKADRQQDPQFSLDPDHPVLVGRRAASGASGEAPLLAKVLLGVTAGESSRVLDEVSARAVRNELPAQTLPILALEWRRRDEFARVAALPVALDGGSSALACAALGAAARRPGTLALADALRHLAALPAVAAAPALHAEVQALARLARSGGGTLSRSRAVLVGLSSPGDGAAGPKNAAASIQAVRDALIGGAVPARSISVLLDGAATGAAVRDALRRAGREAQRHAVLVYWCGPGFLDALPCFDGVSITPGDLAALAGAQATLLADGVAAGLSPPPTAAGQGPTLRLALAHPDAAGGPISGRGAGAGGRPAAQAQARLAPLAEMLVQALQRQLDLHSIRASTLTTRDGRPLVRPRDGDDRLLFDPIVGRADALAGRIRDAELASTAALLAQLLEQRNGLDPEAQLQLGILLAERGDTDGAVAALERAIQQFGDDDAAGEALARLQLGRALLHGGRDRARAVSECRLATERDPELVAAWFWLGRAISELIQRETSTQASQALRTYLARGAPLGRRAEVAALLGAMAGQQGAAGAGV